MKIKLDSFESQIEKNAEKYQKVDDKQEKKIERILASSKKDKTINIRLNSMDLDLLRQRAGREGLPYQTMITSVLHKFVTDQYLERKNLNDLGLKLPSKDTNK